MPTMANITVKKNDGTTDVIYNAMTPSSGDTVPAQWRSVAGPAAYAGLKPELRCTSRWNAAKTLRRFSVSGVYPSTIVDADGKTVRLGAVTLDVQVGIPQNIPQTDIDEGVSQLTNLIVSTLIRSSMKDGFAPT